VSTETNSTFPDNAERQAQVRRILASRALRASESLRRLLEVLVDFSEVNPGSAPKEYVLATEVLGRGPDFDPQVDPVVRVQVGRLRSKLAEYYMTEGRQEPVLLEIPRGSHSVRFSRREMENAGGEAPAADASLGAWIRRHRTTLIATAAAVVLTLLGTWLMIRPTPPPRSLQALWQPFLASDRPPLVVFSNAEFFGSPRDGLRYFRHSTDDPRFLTDTYTGVGEVYAVRALTSLFDQLRSPIRLKRGRLVTWDEDKSSSLIFVGSPAENAETRVLSDSMGFRFKSKDWEPEVGRPGVWNRRPAKGEPELYLAKAAPPYVDDYAVVSLLNGLEPGRWAMILAGCRTHGTGAAAEFAANPEKVAELLTRLTGSANPSRVPPFEALLYLHIVKGAPTQVDLVTVHSLER
jgi:hypothetical protein